MQSRLHPLTSAVVTALCLALVLAFVPDADAVTYTWDGGGDPDDGGNWSDVNNWIGDSGYPSTVADSAVLPAPSALRVVTVDVAVAVAQVQIPPGSANHINQIKLAADMTAIDLRWDWGGYYPLVDLNGFTFSSAGNLRGWVNFFAKISGSGEFVKINTDTMILNGELSYTGSFMVTNGVLAFRCGDFSATSMIVTNGGTARSYDVCATFPGTIEIHGDGYTSLGAIYFTASGESLDSDVTVASDAKIKCTSGTATMTGDILGSGVLTLEGPQTLKISATGITYTNKLIITNGTTQITGTFPDLKHILVDKDGILEGLQSQFPNATVITQNGGQWIQNLSATWTGSGDGSSWSDTSNWSPEIVPTNVATLPYPGSTRTVRVDVATNVNQLAMANGALNIVELDADLAVTLVDHPDDAGGNAEIDLNGNTLTVDSGSALYFPRIDGAGTFEKIGTGTVVLNGELSYTGSFMVRNGILAFRCGDFSATSMIVTNGGTARSHDVCATFPGTIEIHGDGYTSLGAIYFNANGESLDSDVTVASDAKMKASSSRTVTLTGNILGPGVLTLEGPGTIEVDNMSITYSNKFVVTNGSVVINGNLPNITNIWVDAGGELEGQQSQFPNATVIETNGGVWLSTANATWTGNGDGSNWTDTANWSPEVVPTNVATIPLPGAARIIVVDAPASLAQLAMADGANNQLKLNADMVITLVDHADDAGGNVKIDLNGNTLTVSSGSALYFPRIGGAGSFVKIGTGQVTLQGSLPYTGSFTASNGVLAFRCGDYSAASATVVDGATAKSHDVCSVMPGTITINGNGYSSRGAIEFATSTDTCASDITVATDAKIECTAAATITLTGSISGPGDLTLETAGTLDLDGTYNFAIDGAAGNKIIAYAGDVNISGATLTVSGEGSGTESEYVVIDFSDSGTVTGTFATENLPEGWTIDYDGTDENPDCVVVELPPPGLQMLFK